jgi:hypothetical protein
VSKLPLFDDADGDLPAVELEPSARPQPWWLRTRWLVVACGLLVVVGLTVGILVFNASAPDAPRGARSPALAARQFVAALNAGDGIRAARVSCDRFGDDARAAARSGADPGISFALVSVTTSDKDNATATLVQQLRLGASGSQRVPYRLALLRGAGLWLVCGRLS